MARGDSGNGGSFVKTPFGELRVADAHAHFFSHHFFEVLARQLPEPPPPAELYTVLGERLSFDFPPEDPAALATTWVEELDRHGIARTVLIASVPSDEESVAAAHRAHPKRLIPYFMLNPKAPDALERTKRAFRELGLKGVCLFPAMHHFHLWDKDLSPIYEQAAEKRGIVFVHTGILKVGIREKLGLESPFDMRFANPLGLSGVARSFPTVPFVLPHFGCGFLRELFLVASECDNIYTDTSSSNSWMEKLPEPLELSQVFGRAISVMGAERVLYGSDSSFFPRGFLKNHLSLQLDTLHALGVSPGDAALVFGGNLERLVDDES
jgi:predicted TIM-barrel fold metal-dependent hydrolase